MPTIIFIPEASASSGLDDDPTSSAGTTIANMWQDVDDYAGGGVYGLPELYNTSDATSVTGIDLFCQPAPVNWAEPVSGSSVLTKFAANVITGASGASDSVIIRVQIFAGDGTALTGQQTIVSNLLNPTTYEATNSTDTITGTATRAQMNAGSGPFIRVTWHYTRSMGSDALQSAIQAIQVTIDYVDANVVADTQPGALTITPYAPEFVETVLVHTPPTGLLQLGKDHPLIFPGGAKGHTYYRSPGSDDGGLTITNVVQDVLGASTPLVIETWLRLEHPSSDYTSNDYLIELRDDASTRILVREDNLWSSSTTTYKDGYMDTQKWLWVVYEWDGSLHRVWVQGKLQATDNTVRTPIIANDYTRLNFGVYENSVIPSAGSSEIPISLAEIRVTEDEVRYGDQSTIPVPTNYHAEDGSDDGLWNNVSLLVNFREGYVNYGYGDVTIWPLAVSELVPADAPQPNVQFTPGFWARWVLDAPPALMAFTGHPPVVITGFVNVPTGVLPLITHIPHLAFPHPPAGALTITQNPPVSYAGPYTHPEKGTLTFTGHPPVFDNNVKPIWAWPRVYAVSSSGLSDNAMRSVVPFQWPDYTGAPTLGDRPRRWQTWCEKTTSLSTPCTFHYIGGSGSDNGDIAWRSCSTVTRAASLTTRWSSEDGVTPELYVSNYDFTDSGLGYAAHTIWASYHSTGGANGYPYGAYAMTRDTSSDSISDAHAYWAAVLQYRDDSTSGYMNRVDPLPYYGSNEGLQDWVGNFYAVDSREGTEEGYLLAPKDVGNDTIAALYQWSGGTSWDAGTNLMDGTEEAVDYIADIVGWCRADQADPDRYYAVVTTRNASTDAFLHFKVFAVVLSTMTITRVINDNVDHGGNGWWHEGYQSGGTVGQNSLWFADIGSFGIGGPEDRRWYGPGTTHVEERCFPVSLGPSSTYFPNEDFYMFRTLGDTGQEQYTRLILNSGNWLAPTFDVRDANLDKDYPALSPLDYGSDEGYVYGCRRYLGHWLLWDSETADGEGLYAMRLCYRSHRDSPVGIEWFASVRNVLDPTDEFTPWRTIWRKTTYPENSTQYGAQSFQWLMGGVRGWGQHEGQRIPITFDGMYTRAQYWNVPDGVYYGIYWWEEGDDFFADVSVAVDLGLENSVLKQNTVYVSVEADLNLQVTMGEVQQYGSMLFTGHYELEDTPSVVNAGLNTPLGLSLDVSDDSSISAQVTAALGLEVAVDHELIQNFRTKSMAVNNAFWGQSWVDELLVYINNVRSNAGLPLMRAIDYIDDQRITANQTLFDPPQRAAIDLARTDSDTPFQVGDYYPNAGDFWSAMNAKAMTFYTDKVSMGSTFPSASSMWGQWSGISGFWDRDWDAYHGDPAGYNTELYVQVGRFWADSATYGSTGEGGNSPREDGAYFFVALTNYTDQPYTGLGGGFQPTPHPITKRTLTTSYAVDGITWLEEFLEILNAARVDAGVKPYLLPDKEFWELYPVDSASIHAINQHDIKLFCHNAPELPAGWRTTEERATQADWKSMLENNIFSQAKVFHDPDNPTAFTYSDVLNDHTFITPLEAFTGWWNSPGHRRAMMFDWGDREVYSVMGWRTVQWQDQVFYDDNVHAGNPQIPAVGQITILVNNFADVTTIMATKYLNANWVFNGAMIEQLAASYDLTAYSDVKGEHEAEYSLRIQVQHEAPYASRAGAQHVAPLFYSVSAAHEAPFVGTSPVRRDHFSGYRIKDTQSVLQDHAAPYGWGVRVGHTALYDEPPFVSASHVAGYDDLSAVRAQHEVLYSAFATVAAAHVGQYTDKAFVSTSHRAEYTTPYGVAASHTSVHALQSLVRVDHEADYTNTQNIRGDHDADYNINTFDTVVTDHTAYHSLLGDAVVTETPTVGITVAGTFIDIDDLVITQGEGDPAWIARARIANQQDYLLLRQQTPVTVSIGAENWDLIVTEQSVSRSEQTSTRMVVKMESPVVNLMSPRAPSTTYRYNTVMSAKDIVEDILGQAVDWQIIDWSVSAGRVAIDDTTPYNAAKLIVGVAGGVIQSKHDGSLLVRYEYPVAMNALYGGPADEVFTDIEDNLSAEEGFEYRTGVNSVRILEGESTYRDRIVWEPEEGDDTRGLLNVYLSPWRTDYTLRYTDLEGPTGLGFAGTITREEIELVEFRNGTANVGYPIKELSTVEWKSDELGAVTFDEYSTSLNAGTGVNQGYGLAEVTYIVQLDTYNVTGVLGDATQFIIEDGE